MLKGKPGAKPEFSDSEEITLLLAQDFIPYPGETQYIEIIRVNYRSLFTEVCHMPIPARAEVCPYCRYNQGYARFWKGEGVVKALLIGSALGIGFAICAILSQ